MLTNAAHGSHILQDGTHFIIHCIIPELDSLETNVLWLVQLHPSLQTSSFHSQQHELNSGPKTFIESKQVIKHDNNDIDTD
jgi:hypothetical protein